MYVARGIRAPGALHHARFLSKGLYILKIVMLADVTPHGLLTPNMLAGLDRMAQFAAIFYAPWFLQARLAPPAPRLDLQLWQDMCEYHIIDDTVAGEVKRSILRHLWYLSEPLVIFELFDEQLDGRTRAAIAASLDATPRPAVFLPGKPVFPVNTLLQVNNLTLDYLEGPLSWLVFHLLDKEGRWLTLPPDTWNDNEEYRSMQSVVHTIAVVNGAAERSVKDVQDFTNAAKDGSYRDQIILVSNSHRAKIATFRKNEMQEKLSCSPQCD